MRSFVTSEEVPRDIDIVLHFVAGDLPAFAASPHARKLASRAAIKQGYKVDLLLGPSAASMPMFFQGLRAEKAHELGVAPNQRKGILKVSL